jgi:tRNA pseudouridine32 synthase/23S rRNA pseudouridine746 synthase
LNFEVVFENMDLIAVDKPHGWLTTPAREATDPRPCLGRELQTAVGRQIFPIHRLDFEVSGVVLFAKTKDAHTAAQKWFESGTIVKTYQAFSAAFGDISEWNEWQVWKSRIAKGKKRAFEAAHGKDAETRVRVIEELNKLFRWELVPMTGRPHQLRFEMYKHGFSILGDVLYGGKEVRVGWIGLRAVSLNLQRIAPDERFGLPPMLTVEPLVLPR